jgi:hypothetical protein
LEESEIRARGNNPGSLEAPSVKLLTGSQAPRMIDVRPQRHTPFSSAVVAPSHPQLLFTIAPSRPSRRAGAQVHKGMRPAPARRTQPVSGRHSTAAPGANTPKAPKRPPVGARLTMPRAETHMRPLSAQHRCHRWRKHPQSSQSGSRPGVGRRSLVRQPGIWPGFAPKFAGQRRRGHRRPGRWDRRSLPVHPRPGHIHIPDLRRRSAIAGWTNSAERDRHAFSPVRAGVEHLLRQPSGQGRRLQLAAGAAP